MFDCALQDKSVQRERIEAALSSAGQNSFTSGGGSLERGLARLPDVYKYLAQRSALRRSPSKERVGGVQQSFAVCACQPCFCDAVFLRAARVARGGVCAPRSLRRGREG